MLEIYHARFLQSMYEPVLGESRSQTRKFVASIRPEAGEEAMPRRRRCRRGISTEAVVLLVDPIAKSVVLL